MSEVEEALFRFRANAPHAGIFNILDRDLCTRLDVPGMPLAHKALRSALIEDNDVAAVAEVLLLEGIRLRVLAESRSCESFSHGSEQLERIDDACHRLAADSERLLSEAACRASST